jgi:hypothetical protein
MHIVATQLGKIEVGGPSSKVEPTTETRRLYARDDALWQAISDFELDEPDAPFPFTARLARDHLWTEDHAARVVREYRCFLYLAAISDEMVTPSPDVDEAWHLHLAYTKSYWERLCRDILGRPLHHEPTEGGAEQRGHFMTCYQRTLDLYREVFGPIAPSDIWPDTDARFEPNETYLTLQMRDYWIARRLWSPQVGRLISGAAIVAVASGAAAAAMLVFPDVSPAPSVAAVAASVGLHTAIVKIFGAGNAILVAELVEGDGGGGCGGCGGCGG